jgi:hypothetical protein
MLFSAALEASLKLVFICEAIAFVIADMKSIDPVIFSPLVKFMPDPGPILPLSIILGPLIICADIAPLVNKVELVANSSVRRIEVTSKYILFLCMILVFLVHFLSIA